MGNIYGNFSVALTEIDFKILEFYKTVLDGLASYLEEGYDFVLHSLHDLDRSVIMNTPLFDVLKTFAPHDAGPREPTVSESFVEEVDDLISETVAEATAKVRKDATISNTNKNKDIVSLLHHKGIFILKDAVVKVADLMGSSKNSLYARAQSQQHARIKQQ